MAFLLYPSPSAFAQHTSQSTPKIAPLEQKFPTQIAGDREFAGNGPRVRFDVSLAPDSDRRTLQTTIDFNAKETGNNRSEAEDKRIVDVYSADQCRLFDSIQSATTGSLHYTDTDHRIDGTKFDETHLGEELRVRGDTSGLDIGNDTPDDTAWWIYFHEARVTQETNAPECRKPDGSPPDVEKVDGQALLAFIRSLFSTATLHFDNVEFPFGGGDHIFKEMNSFLEIDIQGVPIRLPFTLPRADVAYWTIFVDDVTSKSIDVAPDGGGYLLTFKFEHVGTEVRSNCASRAILNNGEFVSIPEAFDLFSADNPGVAIFASPTVDPTDPRSWVEDATSSSPVFSDEFLAWREANILEWFGNGYLVCGLGNELQVNLNQIEADLRFRFFVEHASGQIRFKQPLALNQREDIFLRLRAESQSRPCDDNLGTLWDECVETEDWGTVLQAALSEELGKAFFDLLEPQAQQSNVFGAITAAIRSFLGSLVGADLLAIFIGDTDADQGDLYIVTR